MEAETLYAIGERDPARKAITVARDSRVARAEKLSTARLRHGFPEGIPENRRTLECYEQWTTTAV